MLVSVQYAAENSTVPERRGGALSTWSEMCQRRPRLGQGRGGEDAAAALSRGLSGLQYPALNTRGHKLSNSRLFSPGSVQANVSTSPNKSRLRKANTKLHWKIEGKVRVGAVSEHSWKPLAWDAYSCVMRTCVKDSWRMHTCTGLFLNTRRCVNSVLLPHICENSFIYEWKHTWVKQVILNWWQAELLHKMHFFFCRLCWVERSFQKQDRTIWSHLPTWLPGSPYVSDRALLLSWPQLHSITGKFTGTKSKDFSRPYIKLLLC